MSAPMAEISEVIGLSVEDGCFSLEIKFEIKAKQIFPWLHVLRMLVVRRLVKIGQLVLK